MGLIIFWTVLTGLHTVNIRLSKDRPTDFWHKSSWFFLGWSTLATLYAIGEYLSA